MAKLFVAMNLPDSVRDELVAIRPPASQGVRPTNSQQLHITLHFIGLADRNLVERSLGTVASPPFSLKIAGVGHFQSPDGGVILFAKVITSQELLNLHKRIGEAFATAGLQVESRPYTPHITLARCQRRRTPGLPDRFLDQHRNFSVPAFTVTEFILYSSHSTASGPVYEPLQTFRLQAPDTMTSSREFGSD